MRAISYAILRRGNEVLLQLRSRTGFVDGFWSNSAAGHVEPGEAADAAAIRETREELGISIDTAQLQPLCAVHRTQPGGTRNEACVDFFFLACQWSGAARIMEPGKAAELRWFRLDALPPNVVARELGVLGRLGSGPRRSSARDRANPQTEFCSASGIVPKLLAKPRDLP